MEFKDIVSISGKAGLFEILKPRQDGLIVAELGDTKKSFVSSRNHNFTPLENIGIYLNSGDTIELSKVFSSIAEQGGNRPLSSDNPKEIIHFFELIIPEYDSDKVKLSDMKKILQWYHILEDKDLIELVSSTTGDEEE